MALGEAVAGEGGQLLPDHVGDLAGDTALGRAVVEALLQPRHALMAALGAHRLAQLVGFGRCEATHVDGDLHELLLEQGHSERLGQARFKRRVQVGDGLGAVAAPDVGVDRSALDGAGPDEGDLHHEVVEDARLEPWQRGHLRAGLDLEHTHRVGPAEHVVDLGVLRDGGQVDFGAVHLADEIDGAVQGLEHPQAEQIELDQAYGSAVVLVPLQHGPVLHAAPLDRADLDDGPVADDHAPRVDPQVTRRVLHLAGQLQHLRWKKAAWWLRPGGRVSARDRCPWRRRPAGRARSPAPWPCRGSPTSSGRR